MMGTMKLSDRAIAQTWAHAAGISPPATAARAVATPGTHRGTPTRSIRHPPITPAAATRITCSAAIEIISARGWPSVTTWSTGRSRRCTSSSA